MGSVHTINVCTINFQAYLAYLESKTSVQLIVSSILFFYKVMARKSERFQSKAVNLLVGLDSNSKSSSDLAIFLSSVQILVLIFHNIGCCQTLNSYFLSLVNCVQVGTFSEEVSIVHNIILPFLDNFSKSLQVI